MITTEERSIEQQLIVATIEIDKLAKFSAATAGDVLEAKMAVAAQAVHYLRDLTQIDSDFTPPPPSLHVASASSASTQALQQSFVQMIISPGEKSSSSSGGEQQQLDTIDAEQKLKRFSQLIKRIDHSKFDLF